MKKTDYKNLTALRAFKQIKPENNRQRIQNNLTVETIQRDSIDTGTGLVFNFSGKGISPDLQKQLQMLADEQQLISKYKALLSGEEMNTGEGRKVLHHLTRGQCGAPVTHEGKDLGTFYDEQKERFIHFAEQVHNQTIKGSTGKPFKRAVQIGIGGSDLGPRAAYTALVNYGEERQSHKIHTDFISNVDPDDAAGILDNVDPEETLFILVSKSGTTQETLTNRQFVLEMIGKKGIPGLKPEKHMIAVTSETSPLAGSPDYLDSFYIDDFIGGRYSLTSAAGGVALTLAFGKEIFLQFLEGAHDYDMHALEEEAVLNAPLMDALIGVYERNICGYPATAVLPYSQGLIRFPAHLQQLDMESNGKQVNRDGVPLSYATGPVIFGEPGTNSQHSFYQLLHQGTDPLPLQFIGFKHSQRQKDCAIQGSTSQQKLNANLCAQIAAFTQGRKHSEGSKNFPGGRPVSLLYADRLTPYVLGALLSHYENKVMFQGFLWNVNSFDQEGVQLGKILTKSILTGDKSNPELNAFAGLFGL